MPIRNVKRLGVVVGAILVGACADGMAPVPAHAPDAAVGSEDAVIAAFTPQDLLFLAGDINADGFAINSAGDVAGDGTDGVSLHAVVWNGTTPTNVSPPGWLYSSLRSINDAGVVVGRSQDATLSNGTGFLWRPGVGFTYFGQYTSGLETFVRDINNSDVIVGSYFNAGGTHAFRYTVAGGFVDLHPAGYIRSEAWAISDNGTVVGTVLSVASGSHAARWSSTGAFLDLGTLGGNTAYAADVNSRDVIVGQSVDASNTTWIFQWRSTTGMVNTGVKGTPTGISGGGRAVGYNFSSIAGTKLGSGAVTSLPGLPTTAQSSAFGVNRCGSIAGTNTIVGGKHAVRWTQPACDP